MGKNLYLVNNAFSVNVFLIYLCYYLGELNYKNLAFLDKLQNIDTSKFSWGGLWNVVLGKSEGGGDAYRIGTLIQNLIWQLFNIFTGQKEGNNRTVDDFDKNIVSNFVAVSTNSLTKVFEEQKLSENFIQNLPKDVQNQIDVIVDKNLAELIKQKEELKKNGWTVEDEEYIKNTYYDKLKTEFNAMNFNTSEAPVTSR
jgi:hypothetical protein